MEPQEEATQIFARVMNILTSPDKDIKASLRLCQHACELLGWKPQREWFYNEVTGYPPGTTIPSYRSIRGSFKWQHEHEGRVEDVLEVMVSGVPEPPIPSEPVVFEISASIDWIIEARSSGSTRETSIIKEVQHPSKDKMVRWRGVEHYSSASFADVLLQIESRTFDFASRSYKQLKFGQAITGIWADYRQQVDASVQGLGFEDHLSEIQSGIESENPESWRSVVFECRSLLTDLAGHLWQDSRQTYEHLPGGGGGPLEVSQDKFANRLAAYLHQKGVSKTRGRFIRDEIAYLSTVIRSLIAYQAKAHKPVRREDARSVVLATYFVIGELVIRTDMQPILEYGEVAG